MSRVSCEGCPLLSKEGSCNLGSKIIFFSYYDEVRDKRYSENCKLQVMQYALVDKPDSITFIPKEVE
jgi:hypothetical protein